MLLSHVIHYVLCINCLSRFTNIQISDDWPSLLSALPCKSLHEAAGYCRNDDNAYKQGRGDADDQGDEEKVSSWEENRENRENREEEAMMSTGFIIGLSEHR